MDIHPRWGCHQDSTDEGSVRADVMGNLRQQFYEFKAHVETELTAIKVDMKWHRLILLGILGAVLAGVVKLWGAG